MYNFQERIDLKSYVIRLRLLEADSLPNLLYHPACQLRAKLRAGRNAQAGAATKGKVTVKGTNTNIQHTINEDERTEFTRHINQVSYDRVLKTEFNSNL